jgi:hypothetical protein
MSRDRVVRAARISSGVGLIVAGVAMLVLPGPGILTVMSGLALLSHDLPAAARLLERARARLGLTPPTPAAQRVPVDRSERVPGGR